MKPVSILFVCLGNICRSPTAHGVFEAMVKAEGLSDLISVDSAGTGDWHLGCGPDERAIRAAQSRGYGLQHLRARQVCAEDFAQFDYILAMDLANLSSLQGMVPAHFAGQLSLFLDYSDLSRSSEANPTEARPTEVPDPYSGGMDGFEQVLEMIEAASQGLICAIKDRSITHQQSS
ncbi:MAG: low molecular weight phosphotyrosine protein phosphatase [Porticoccaceae bacterium]|nr:low molecular weight phosphotyrosine protein phosphatase [Porticoccaceae bacterium]